MTLRSAFILGIALGLAANGAFCDNSKEALDRYMAQLESTARMQDSGILRAASIDDLSRAITSSRGLAASGDYAQAANVLSALLEGELAADSRAMVTARLEILQKWAANGHVELADFRAFYLDTGIESIDRGAMPIVALWKLDGIPALEKYAVLQELCDKRGDRVGKVLILAEKERLDLEAVVASPTSSRDEVADALLKLGKHHYRYGECDQAQSAWQRVARDFTGTPAWPEALFKSGSMRKEIGDFDGALQDFSLLLAAAKEAEANGARAPYGDRIPWETGNCLLGAKRYREALEVYRETARKSPSYRQPSTFYQGLCHEWLGNLQAALPLYFKVAFTLANRYVDPGAYVRITDLYRNAGQLDDLLRILDAMDAEHQAQVRALVRERELEGRPLKAARVEEMLQGTPTWAMRRFLSVQDMEKRRDWDGLIALLKIKGTLAGPDEETARMGNWEATEAACLLARHPDEAVPLLIARIPKADRQDVKWLYYALGRCGTEEAVASLTAYARQESNVWWVNAVVYALSLTGEKGEAALGKLEKEETRNSHMKRAIARHRLGRLGGRDVVFPQISPTDPFPRTLDEMRRAVEAASSAD